MLLSSNEVRQKTEWEKFDKLDAKNPKSNEKNLKIKKEPTVIDEYGQLFSVLTAEYLKQIEFLSKLQESNYQSFLNSISMWENFFSTSYEINRKFFDYKIS